MDSSIIRLSGIRRSKIIMPVLNTAFPQVYRVEGKTTNPKLADFNFGPRYTLDAADTCGLSKATVRPIDRLDPAIDFGWVLLRHHATYPELDSYLSALWDSTAYWDDDVAFRAFELDLGLYTLVQRPATEQLSDHLLIYFANLPNPTLAGRCMNWAHVVYPDGAVGTVDDLIPTKTPVAEGKVLVVRANKSNNPPESA